MADTKISALTALDNSTIDVLDVLPIVDVSANQTDKITYQNLMNPKASTFRVVDSSDLTKKVAFDASGITTGTTRTLTIPDASTTIVGTDTTQTLTNKTLTSPKITAGSMSKGDLFQLSASDGTLTPLRATSDGDIISWNASLSQWQNIPNPAAANASTTVKGVIEIATDAEVNAGTATGGTGAILAIAASSAGPVAANKIVQFTSATKYPVADGSLITNLSAVSKLSAVYTDVTLDNSSTETIIFSISVPASTLSTNNAVRLKLFLDQFITANARTAIFRLKYGSTTLVTSNSFAPSTTNEQGYIEAIILATGATNSQEASMTMLFNQETLTAGAGVKMSSFGTGTATEDSTGALNLVVTAQWSAANTGSTIRVSNAIAEIIR